MVAVGGTMVPRRCVDGVPWRLFFFYPAAVGCGCNYDNISRLGVGKNVSSSLGARTTNWLWGCVCWFCSTFEAGYKEGGEGGGGVQLECRMLHVFRYNETHEERTLPCLGGGRERTVSGGF